MLGILALHSIGLEGTAIAMASLSPGVLSKLLQNAGNKDAKVTGEHRSALLQVIEIVPSSLGLGDDPWQNRGFFLKVSDSLHSAYVSVSDEDADLIYNDKIQLGQFVYVSRLDSSSSSVPVLLGLKPVPRRRPCVGKPVDLVSSDSLPIRSSGHDFKSVNASKTTKDTRRLSLDTARRIWDQKTSPTTKKAAASPIASSRTKSTTCEKKALTAKNDSSSSRRSSVSALKNKNEINSPKSTEKPLKKELKSSAESVIPSCLAKVPLSFKTWSEKPISWDELPPTISGPGREVVSHRNLAFLTAVRALEEASAAETAIRCLTAFSELCEVSQEISSGSLVEQYLDLHESIQKAAMKINSVLSTGLIEAKSSGYVDQLSDECKTLKNRNSLSWIHAAIETNLSKFNLLKMPETSGVVNGEKFHYVIIENSLKELNSENHSPQQKQIPRSHGGVPFDSSSKGASSPARRHLSVTRKLNPARESCSKGSGLKEASSLVEILISTSRKWFLKYLEDSLKTEFGLHRKEGKSEIGHLLRQLKRVNQWLDDFVGGGVEVDGRIESLRKKLYRFLLENVDSAVASGK
ncbi:uncharacterized protein LOC120014728 isoform X2 [Tripterygium wilfordii]|uniref:uncharacterized protein LOC120014728 isoform X2 n=1 Tax=Tripterygium wilfordii TaxID=458696 RepID=UPI0018F7EB4B|nr:uncharacterized protein LOC120014728 isoform X2 [Tripterygium wilfordii]